MVVTLRPRVATIAVGDTAVVLVGIAPGRTTVVASLAHDPSIAGVMSVEATR